MIIICEVVLIIIIIIIIIIITVMMTIILTTIIFISRCNDKVKDLIDIYSCFVDMLIKLGVGDFSTSPLQYHTNNSL